MNDSNLNLREKNLPLAEPAMCRSGPLLIAGLREPMTERSHETIPQLWQSLNEQQGAIPNRVDGIGYGLCIHARDNGYYYMAGFGVSDFTGLPLTFSAMILPSQQYGVFFHAGDVSRLRDTINGIFDTWLPQSRYALAAQPEDSLHFFERYGEHYDPVAMRGDIEIWVPLRER